MQRIDQLARDAQLTREVVTGAEFRHVVYRNTVSDSSTAQPSRLLVFLDGDGRPWTDDGRKPSKDPTTRSPIALRLLASSRQPGIYISRPCYQQMMDAKCTNDIWTAARYSPQVVDSMAAVVRHTSRASAANEIVMVGYSGGGALAVLVAERLTNVAAVITIGANLDIDAWTKQHGYLPLTTSLNPAQSELPHSWREIHFSGAHDTVVPTATRASYFRKFANAKEQVLPEFDHVCCWVREWPTLLQQAEQLLSMP
jgi:pimeloyl-ACP methyl ester carboxylesterase